MAHTLYIGTQPEPEERTQIQVSDEDMAAIAAVRGLEGVRLVVTDLTTGHDQYIKTADCGLSCYCAVDFA
jgi:hypothetical protein